MKKNIYIPHLVQALACQSFNAMLQAFTNRKLNNSLERDELQLTCCVMIMS